MKRIFLLCLTALFAIASWADESTFLTPDFEVDGIYYHILDDGSVAVTGLTYYESASSYVGEMVIPAFVTYDNTTYAVTSIGERAFYECTNLTSVSLPETITSLGIEAFAYSGITEITIPDNVSIGNYAFTRCGSLTSISFPETITTISEGVCYYCQKLEEVTIGSNVTYICYWAFYNCTKLEKFYSFNPEPPVCELYDVSGRGVSYQGPFEGSSYKTACTLYVPYGSLEMYDSADEWTDFFQKVEMDETITPPTVETLAVTDITNSTATLHGTVSAGSEEIMESGFQYWTDLNAIQTIVATSVSDEEISSTIQRLESATEYTYRAYATTATETTYGERMTFTTTNYDFCEDGIYYYKLSNSTVAVQYLYYASADNGVAYEGELTIPETVTHEGMTYRVVMINEYAFYECRNLTKVVIPNCITDIGPNSFQNCTSLEEATFPNTVSTMWEYTFDGCTSLKEVIIPSSVTSVREYVFQGCTSITELTFPNTVKTLGTGIFQNCIALKKVTLEEGVTNTGYSYMFAGCTSLEDVSVPNTVTEFGTYTFYGCTSLKSFVYPDSMTDTGAGAFDGCTSLEEVTFSKNITEISNFTFAYCTFKEMTIPEGVTTIGYQIFIHNPNLTTVSLPRTVESIDYQLIRDCPSMEQLYSLNPTPPVRGAHPTFEPFEDISENCVLYVPAGSREVYSTADMWEGYFKDIIEVALVETFDADSVGTTSAILNGAVTAGDTPITQKGFEFWKNGSENVITTIYVEEDDLTFFITNLDPETNYTYRAFAVTADGTFYGEDVVFTTLEDIPDGIDSVGMSSSNSENIEGIYSTSGQKLNTTQKGVNIIRYTDGTTKKVIIK